MLKAAIAIGVLIVLLLFGREAAARLPAYAAWVGSLGAWGPAVFIAGYGAAAVLLIPGVWLTIAAGALWGVLYGVVYAMLGASLGAMLAFWMSRYAVRGFVESYVARHPRLAAVDRAVESEGARLIFLLRLSPAVPYILLNYILGISRVRARDYAVGLLGMIPALTMYVYAGKVVGDVAALASGAAAPRGPAYWALIGVGLVTTVIASVLIARAAARTIRVDDAKTP